MFRPIALLTLTLMWAGTEARSADHAVETGPAAAGGANASSPVVIENESCGIEFDRDNGGLRRITNRLLGDECLKGGRPGVMPFRIYADMTKEFDITINNKFQLVFDDPASICKAIIQPENCRLVDVDRTEGLTLCYRGDGFETRLHIRLAEHAGTSDWSLRLTNTGGTKRDFLVCFPCLDGVRLGPDPAKDLATAMDQAGVVVPAWERAGGVLGESNQMSMQWHAIWDHATRSALAVIFMDPDVRPKRLLLAEPRIELHYFPPVVLAPDESCELPPARMLVYKGDWRPAARAYRAWHERAYAHVDPPAWFRQSDGNTGVHFKKGGAGVVPAYGGQIVLESFRNLPAAHLRGPIDNWEYAFYCRGSIPVKDREYTPHTDGDNIIREDMGGAVAMRDGIAGVHRLGLHVTLYVEGYIVHQDSELARSGKAERWAVMRKDGTLTGPYSKQGFYHMCPGSVEWQDHLTSMVARLLRETGADGVRLDSLGFYYLPCYNPAHKHATPFGYNEWIKQLLAKVRKAAIAVRPDVLLLTEGSADWFGPWFHGALTSRCPRDLSMMRLAVRPFQMYVYASGALWGALSGYPGGGCSGPDIHTADWNWLCARFPAHEALVWGDVADEDPQSSDPEIVARRFEGDGYWAIVAARPACQDPLVWPRGTGLSERRGEYVLTLSRLAPQVDAAVVCDVEALTWLPLAPERQGKDLRLRLRTNWALVILRRPGGPRFVSFDSLPQLRKGASTKARLTALVKADGGDEIRATVSAPGLRVEPSETAVPGDVTIGIPADALPGNYSVRVAGRNVLGIRRFLVVE
jgi:hypothetical protein